MIFFGKKIKSWVPIFMTLSLGIHCHAELDRSNLDITNAITLSNLLQLRNQSTSSNTTEETNTPTTEETPSTPLSPPMISVRRSTGETLNHNDSLAFGKAGTGGSGTGKTISIQIYNTGQADLTIQEIKITIGTEFTIANPGSSTILGGQSTTVELKFNPTITGVLSTQLEILSNSSTQGTFLLTLNGEGVAVDTGLSVHFRFSGNLADSSGNGITATPFGTLTYAEDRKGNPNSAIVGDGSDANHFQFDLSPGWAWNSTYSVTAWVYSTTDNFNILSRGFVTTCTTQIVLLVNLNTIQLARDSFSCGGWNVPTSNTTSASIPGRWVHLAYVANSGNITFYVDGVFLGTFPILGSPSAGGNNFGILRNQYLSPLSGRLDELRVYNTTALTSDQVQAIFNQD